MAQTATEITYDIQKQEDLTFTEDVTVHYGGDIADRKLKVTFCVLSQAALEAATNDTALFNAAVVKVHGMGDGGKPITDGEASKRALLNIDSFAVGAVVGEYGNCRRRNFQTRK